MNISLSPEIIRVVSRSYNAYDWGVTYYRTHMVTPASGVHEEYTVRVSPKRVRHVKVVEYDREHLPTFACDCGQERPWCQHMVAVALVLNNEKEKEEKEAKRRAEIAEREQAALRREAELREEARAREVAESARVKPAEPAARKLQLPKSERDPDIERLFQEFDHMLLEDYPMLLGQVQGDVLLKPGLHIVQHDRFGLEGNIEFTVGRQRMYVVRDVYGFADNVRAERTVAYGKGLEFTHAMREFHPSARPIVSYLCDTVDDVRKVYGRDMYAPRASRTLSLTPVTLKRLFEILNGESVDVTLSLSAFLGRNSDLERALQGPMKLQIGTPDVQFKIWKQDETAMFTQDAKSKCHLISLSPCVVLSGDTLYLVPERDALVLGPVLALMEKKGDKNAVPAHYLPSLVSYASVTLEKRRMLRVQSGMATMTATAVEVKIYLDRVEDGVTAGVKFAYVGREGQTQVFRDLERENEVVCALLSYGFARRDATNFTLTGEDELLRFVGEGIAKLRTLGEVFATDALKRVRLRPSSAPQVGVRLSGGKLLMRVHDDSYTREELWELLAASREKRKYHRLNDGSFVSLDDPGLRQLSSLVDAAHVERKAWLSQEELSMPEWRAAALSAAVTDQEALSARLSREFRERAELLTQFREADVVAPAAMEPKLREYQKAGFKWLKALESYGMGGILADEMGLGKTIMAITLMLAAKGLGGELVVCPTSLMLNWKSELSRFAPGLSVCVVVGDAPTRQALLAQTPRADVLVTSYDLIRRDIELYEPMKFEHCFLDEAQYIKNSGTQNAQAVKRIDARVRYALTGTPVENSPAELWSIFDFLMPGYLGAYAGFRGKYELPIVRGDEQALSGLHAQTSPFILRRLKRDVLKQLPEKIETLMASGMTPAQRKLYAAYSTKALSEFDEEVSRNGLSRSTVKILALLTRLRQLCAHPGLFIEDYDGGSGKQELFMEVVHQALGEGHRMLVFSQFAQMLDMLSKELDAAQIAHFMLTGSTPAAERMEMVDAFNAGERPVFLLSLKAGGVGLNLTGADTVVHYDPWWNPASENQATDRAHRIGQERTVHVIKLFAESTLEERIIELQGRKRELAEQLLSGEGGMISKMDVEEIRALFQA